MIPLKALTTQELHRCRYVCLLVLLYQNPWYPSRTNLVHFQFFLQNDINRCFSYTNPVRQLSNAHSAVPLYHIPHRIHQTRLDKSWSTRSGLVFGWGSSVWKKSVPLVHKRAANGRFNDRSRQHFHSIHRRLSQSCTQFGDRPLFLYVKFRHFEQSQLPSAVEILRIKFERLRRSCL